MDIISQCQLSTVIGLSFYEIDLDSIPNSNKNTQTAVCIREFESLTTTHKWKIILQNHDTYILKHFEPGTTQSSLNLWKVRCENRRQYFLKTLEIVWIRNSNESHCCFNERHCQINIQRGYEHFIFSNFYFVSIVGNSCK